MSLPLPSGSRLDAVLRRLWSPGTVAEDADGNHCFMVVDTARDPSLYPALVEHQDALPMVSLYQGALAENLADVAPYLVGLTPGEPFARWLVAQGWGRAWGIFVQSAAGLDVVRRRLRRFNMANTDDGKSYMFRFYDPRVLRSFLPIASPEQLASLFTDVGSYMMEDGDGAALLEFQWIDDGRRALRHPLPE